VDPFLPRHLLQLFLPFFSFRLLLRLELSVLFLVFSDGLKINFSLFESLLHGRHSAFDLLTICLPLPFLELLVHLLPGLELSHLFPLLLVLFVPLCSLLFEEFQLLSYLYFPGFCFLPHLLLSEGLFLLFQGLNSFFVLPGLLFKALFEPLLLSF
jgi:hypothetical protein